MATNKSGQDRFRLFYDETLTGNFVMKPEGQILTVNAAFVRMFGFTSEKEALSANFLALVRKAGAVKN